LLQVLALEEKDVEGCLLLLLEGGMAMQQPASKPATASQQANPYTRNCHPDNVITSPP
jgi:hypothetical protein